MAVSGVQDSRPTASNLPTTHPRESQNGGDAVLELLLKGSNGERLDVDLVEIKLFVGRVPRGVDENHLRVLFSQYGRVKDVLIIKDRVTNEHKGSAFVRMASIAQADAAIRALHGRESLDSSLGPLQVRYATREPEKLGIPSEAAIPGSDWAKLFVGSLPRNVVEEEIREIFSQCGVVDEIYLMKDPSSQVGRGCAFVKMAFKEQALAAIKRLNAKKFLQDAAGPLEVRFAESKKNTIKYKNNANPRSQGPWKEYFTDDGRAYYYNELTKTSQWEKPPNFHSLPGGASHQNKFTDTSSSTVTATGPPGANVFVFHVPNDWTQAELIDNFGRFGEIVSARIATDKQSNRNRGFAFVSYANIEAAAQAVMKMNGFLAGNKRLKVSIKQNEEQFAAHLFNSSNFNQNSYAADRGQVPKEVEPYSL